MVNIYIQMVAGLAAHFRRSPDRLGRPHIEQYLLFIRDVKKVSYCWYNQCVCALRFFYLYVLDRPRLVQRIPFGHRERHLSVVLSVDELLAFLAAIRSLRDRVILTVLYSAGIRLGEVYRLRVDDIDSSRMLLRIQQGKGHKDRFAPCRRSSWICSASGGAPLIRGNCSSPIRTMPRVRSARPLYSAQ